MEVEEEYGVVEEGGQYPMLVREGFA